MKKILQVAALLTAGAVLPSVSNAMTIGYFDTSRELYGFDGASYLSQAKQYLVDQGHTLVNTNSVDAAFLSGVDAFYTGLIGTVSQAEIAAMKYFVDVQGGFLFIQTDWTPGSWTNAANDILSNWGISHSGNYANDSNHSVVGSTDWVGGVGTFIGSAHSVVTQAPNTFEVLAVDDLQQTILGVFDAGGGRSSDVLISTDINMWDNSVGWNNANNQQLWANIWQNVETETGGNNPVPEPTTLLLFGVGLAGLTAIGRKRK
nr:PEP-CTERM sorting domain-containing protein [uncultured Desulfobulbus sp.]